MRKSPLDTRPECRPLRIFAFDPMISRAGDHRVTVEVPYRPIEREERCFYDDRLEVVDYDAEWVHEQVRETYGLRTIIPPERGRPSEKPPVGRWRRWMRQQLDNLKAKYGQRWQTETVNSMIKRRLGSALRARTYWSQCREIILRVITHNVMIVASG